MKDVKCAIIGRPSSGKSTFVNTVCENKVSIVSSVPQSTLCRVNGAYNDSRGRIVFIDTPGIHIDSRNFNTRLTKGAVNAIRDSECVLYILDANDFIAEEEKKTCFYASTSSKPVVAFINKTDIAKENCVEEKRKFLEDNIPQAVVLSGSALNDEGLDEVLIEIFKYAREVDEEYIDQNQWTDSTIEFRISEEIRQEVFNSTKKEIPHSVFALVDSIDFLESEKKVIINASLLVEQSSQKGILIGRNGSMIKKIRTAAQRNIKKIFPNLNVNLFLSVKVHPNWKKDKKILDKLNI